MNSETPTDSAPTAQNTYQEVSFIRSASVPALVLSVLVAGLSYFLPVWVGLSLVIAFLLWQLSAHYRELKLFALWLSHPTSKNVPSGHGVWTDIFAKLYALRRSDEKNEAHHEGKRKKSAHDAHPERVGQRSPLCRQTLNFFHQWHNQL